MKTILSALVASLFVSVFAFSQDGAPRPRAVPVPPQPPQPGQSPRQQAFAQQQSQVPAPLERNISISLTGTLAKDLPISVTMTGCGTRFQCDVAIGSKAIGANDVPIIGTINFVVSMKGEEFLISYSIGARIPVPTSTSVTAAGGGTTTSISYESMMLTGEAKCAFDKEVGIFKSGDQVLALKVTLPE